MHYRFFPEEEQELQRELVHHPELIKRLQNHPQNEQEIIIAEIATYCEVVLEGTYTPEMLTRLCGILARRLKERRPRQSRPMIIVNSYGVEDIEFKSKE